MRKTSKILNILLVFLLDSFMKTCTFFIDIPSKQPYDGFVNVLL